MLRVLSRFERSGRLNHERKKSRVNGALLFYSYSDSGKVELFPWKMLASRTTAALLFVPGFCLGWLVGLSISPVTEVVVASTVTLIVGAASLLAGVPLNETKIDGKLWELRARISVVPISFLMIGLAMGTALGIYARTHDLLGRSDKQSSSSASTRTGASNTAEVGDHTRETVLYALPDDQCKALRGELLRGSLRRGMLVSTDPHLQNFASKVHDEGPLQAALEELICPANK